MYQVVSNHYPLTASIAWRWQWLVRAKVSAHKGALSRLL